MTLTLKTAFAAVAFAAGFGSTLNGQTGTLRVDVPFAFEACNRALPAGTYDITTYAASGHVAILSFETGRICYATAMVGSAARVAESTLVSFRQYGGNYSLHGLQYSGSGNRVRFAPSPAMQKLAKASAYKEIAILAAGSR